MAADDEWSAGALEEQPAPETGLDALICPICLSALGASDEGGSRTTAAADFSCFTPMEMVPGAPADTAVGAAAAPASVDKMAQAGAEISVIKDCGHAFDKACLMQWVARGGDSCPVCRAPIPGVERPRRTKTNPELFSAGVGMPALTREEWLLRDEESITPVDFFGRRMEYTEYSRIVPPGRRPQRFKSFGAHVLRILRMSADD
ncbi:hypothetical protein FVE85_2353 [Porphyridium purpureum]|uniref:RING-type domain-containing protein n=1 Tax=Porphyridium purpureum TaxID=35688 RepID=A0A5J4YYJ9_PORPP|nr:hypothetical protein FVE85_2353 [Porphyridium purpureum]|eukprot:POR5033..scf209_3